MDYKHNKSLVSNARNLRKNMTKEERHLWYDFLRSYPAKFLRQKILGKDIMKSKSAAKLYIADFVMIFIFTVALGIIGTGEHVKYCIIYYILFLGVTVALLAANVRFVRDTMKAIYQVEAQ